VTKKGKTDRVIVIGGHHDKVREGAGSIDNGTGSTMVANLYQALRDQDTDATIVFIAFGREEEGLLGSQAYLDSLTDAQKSKIDAMVNLDTLAVNGTFSWKNNSTRALLDRVKQVAADTHHDLVEAHLDGGDADSSSFRQAGIPAITIYGASEDVIFDIIHSGRDTMGAFDLGHYRNAYLLTLEFLKSLDKKKLGPVGEGNV
jgi:Zn-dependent M28 family amino/carboxypeptidase